MRFFYLYAGIYSSPCRFSSLKNFVGSLSAFADSTTLDQCLKDLDDKAELLRADEGPLTESSAKSRLIAKDLDCVRKSLSVVDVSAIQALRDDPLRDFNYYTSALKALGAEFDEPQIRTVEEFPAPFNRFQWAAFCPDAEDEKRYGIARGIYFRRSALRPYYTQALLAHEMIHCIPGKRDPNILAMGLEEGIADLLGSLHLVSLRYGKHIARNLYIYARHAHPMNQIWKLYLDHARQAAIIYKKFGLTGLVFLLNSGRRVIHEVEGKLRIGHFSEIHLPTGDWNPILDEIVDEALLGYPSNYVIPPLGYHLLEFIQEGASISEICSRASVPIELGRQTLEQLSANTTLFLIDNNRIGYSNVHWYLGTEDGKFPTLRYEI